MISYRTLRNWRKDALAFDRDRMMPTNFELLMNSRILRLTQELMDLHLKWAVPIKREEEL
jgi:hypothetical protein